MCLHIKISFINLLTFYLLLIVNILIPLNSDIFYGAILINCVFNEVEKTFIDMSYIICLWYLLILSAGPHIVLHNFKSFIPILSPRVQVCVWRKYECFVYEFTEDVSWKRERVGKLKYSEILIQRDEWKMEGITSLFVCWKPFGVKFKG